ncbi:hypothetical protein SAMN06296036_119102 [Pseudobacteriovorax antillogorgiicola]|uniref:Uncharacterized protein n=1 Tax=Pseudobacteriovorax antillogorgiicola TaxID=1513793 RepID=A0A1Y6CLP4_9BACT|nr:hypothetical protein EDD56_119101 [Pseudobacteriovorax antillogorgiicola]SMF58450.1 hypothetical protein SAMN06296036_119102 [Pseudobacteriovorax antillogorgiicola]
MRQGLVKKMRGDGTNRRITQSLSEIRVHTAQGVFL